MPKKEPFKRNEQGEISNLDDFIAHMEQAAAYEKLEKIEITKVKIKDRQLFVNYNELDCNGNYVEVTIKSNAIAHDDLMLAFSTLRLHMAHICELKESKVEMCEEYYLHEDLGRLSVTGFSYGGENDGHGIVIMGQRSNKMGVLNLVTPFLKLEDYPHEHLLLPVLEHCKEEVKLYLAGKAYSRQIEMKF